MGSLTLVQQPVEKKENSEFKPVKLRLKIDLVSHPARGVVKYIQHRLQQKLFYIY